MTIELRKAILVASAIVFLTPVHSRATETRTTLQRNPFAQPDAGELTTDAARMSDDLTVAGESALRAVLVAGSRSVVDFGGAILKIGESAYGYRLVSVEEDKATFDRDDKEIVFWLYGPESGE